MNGKDGALKTRIGWKRVPRVGLMKLVVMMAGVFFLVERPAVAKTEPDSVHAEISRGAKPCSIEGLKRPYVLLSRERLDALREEIKKPGRARDLFEREIKSNADRWVTRRITIPARAGHYHNFTCSDGTRLELPKNQEMGTKGPYRCPTCGKLYRGEKYDAALRYMEHAWLITACRDLALTYALTGEKRYGVKAAEILRKYADAYPGRHTSLTKGGIFYQSLDESMYIIVLAQAYDLLHDSGLLSPQDIKHIEYDLFWECGEGLTKMGMRGNWGSWHLSAVGVIGLATKHQRFIDFGVKEFKRQISEELGSDGLWPESVQTYHFFPLRGFLLFAEAAANAGIDLYHWNAGPNRSLKAMLLQPLYYMYPNLRLPAINDGWFNSFLPADQYDVAWYRYGLPEFAWALKECYRKENGGSAGAAIQDPIWGLVLGKSLPESEVAPKFTSTNFDNIGIAVLRTGRRRKAGDEIMMTFDYGRMLGHGQADKMGVTLFANGRLFAADYGTPSYGSAILPYYRGTSSHNTIVVDGKNQRATKKNGLLGFKSTPGVTICAAETPEAYPGVDWRRTVLLSRDYGVVVDDLVSKGDHTYDSFFHSEGDIFGLDGVAKSDSSSTFTYPHIADVQGYRELGDSFGALWGFRDGPGLLMTMSCGSGGEVFSARCPAETGARTVPLVVVRKGGKKVRFVMVLLPLDQSGWKAESGTGIRPTIEEGEDGEIRIGVDGHTDTIRLSDREAVFQKGGSGEPIMLIFGNQDGVE